MIGGVGTVIPQADWNILMDPGDEVHIFGETFFFERVDPDDVVTFRPPMNANRGEFMIKGGDGQPRKPSKLEVATIWRDGNLEFREKLLGSAVRRFARNVKLDADQARAQDEGCSFRAAVLRKYDAAPWSKSDKSLRQFMQEALADPEIAKLPRACKVCPSTLRTWLKNRGTEGCRKERDGISMTGRMPRKMRIEHPSR